MRDAGSHALIRISDKDDVTRAVDTKSIMLTMEDFQHALDEVSPWNPPHPITSHPTATSLHHITSHLTATSLRHITSQPTATSLHHSTTHTLASHHAHPASPAQLTAPPMLCRRAFFVS